MTQRPRGRPREDGQGQVPFSGRIWSLRRPPLPGSARVGRAQSMLSPERSVGGWGEMGLGSKPGEDGARFGTLLHFYTWELGTLDLHMQIYAK